MTINWQRGKDTDPRDNQECFITTEGSTQIIGPIVYKKENRMWIDLFATPEAGHSYSVDSKDYDLWWCDMEEINTPGDEDHP